VAKLLSTDHEELYKNILKPSIKVGNDFVSQEEVRTAMQAPT
jgi:myosin heavy subunit